MGLRANGRREETQRILDFGYPECGEGFADNRVTTSRYSLFSFLPVATSQQFRKMGNRYFLCIGILMAVGTYTNLFYSAFPPTNTLGPLALMVFFSLVLEGYADVQRHLSDKATNYHPCVVLRRAEELDRRERFRKERTRDPHLNGGKDVTVTNPGREVPIAFESVYRMDIRAGNLVVVRNRDMIPADLILLASSNEGGNAYVETSSIDGETNLKLRNSPHIPTQRLGTKAVASNNSLFNGEQEGGAENESCAESLSNAVERLAKMSLLGHPDGVSALANPSNGDEQLNFDRPTVKRTLKGTIKKIKRKLFGNAEDDVADRRRTIPAPDEEVTFITSLTSEPPNAHIDNYMGKLTLPPNSAGERSQHAPLDAENILLRGAVLRNTDWVIGLACFTGVDTKLVMNSVATPSKFSQLDKLINRCVYLVLFINMVSCCSLGVLSVLSTNKRFDQLWYAGYSKNLSDPWPYFNLDDSLGVPVWQDRSANFLQNTFMFVTMLSNFVPMALYIAVELITLIMMLFVGWDLSMYHEETDTPAAARTTTVTDLGLVEYIFSDKTGTLTSNIMEFKRCSVDGHAFGMPVNKASPQPTQPNDGAEILSDSVHPLKHLLASPNQGEESKNTGNSHDLDCSLDTLSFNAEMFLRVMSICHTVVVEKDHDFASSSNSKKSPKSPRPVKKKKDGAPTNYAYQAESPDEGALVAAASNEFGFQLLGRNSSGVRISCSCPSLLAIDSITKGLKTGTITVKALAAQTSFPSGAPSKYSGLKVKTVDQEGGKREETWSVLAVNKFDSDRKRMSVLVRSPLELGGIPMLLCKGADSSMLLEGVCDGVHMLNSIIDKNKTPGPKPESEADNSKLDSLLSIQAHLGEFASEGLRTLVLGVKILSENDTDQWLSKFKQASTSIEDRDQKLTTVAYEIEKDLHIVGATAIEDRLQGGVPDTIANLGKAGIKLWVLTGDKRETAIEIGYSTKVLTPKMHLTEVFDAPSQNVKALVAMELMRHIKIGNLPSYQLAALDEVKGFTLKSIQNLPTSAANWWSKVLLSFQLFYLKQIKWAWLSKDDFQNKLEQLREEIEAQKRRTDPRIQRRKVRELAREIINSFWNDPQHTHLKDSRDDEISIVSDDPPAVFTRAKSAKESLRSRQQSKGKVTNPTRVEKLALAKVSTSNRDAFDEEALSMQSYTPVKQITNFDKRKRTVFERVFAVDKDVRHGRLTKHLKDEYKEALSLDNKEQTGKKEIESMVRASSSSQGIFDVSSVKRGFVVEGAALKHFMGNPVLEEMLFAVASCSESVIACRVSPKQKALLLKMVRRYVSPTPTTLAIGDGANDVGMIQEAHIGIGISGLEGQQAVNASDFSIAQFRFLEPLLLIHGRWNFMRMSKAVLLFFYKNSLLVGTMMMYSERCLHSGTSLYDTWVVSVFNFVGASMPVVMMAVFDRDIPKDYVLRNSQVYQCGPNNEFLSFRVLLRWVVLTFIHSVVIYLFSAPALYLGGGVTSAYKGLMGHWDRDTPGDGEGEGLKVFGTTIYSQVIYVVTLKALYETRTIVNGEFPTFTCKQGKGEGWTNRVGYTWVGVTWISILFYYFFLYTYQLIGRDGPDVSGTFFPFVFISNHMMNMRSITWMISILTPTICCIIDITGKVFSNMFYPTKTQIHAEIAASEC